MDDPSLVTLDAPIDKVRIAAYGQNPRPLFASQAACLRKLFDQFNGLVHYPGDVASALRIALIDIGKDRIHIAARPRRVAHPHRPKRFQSAAISASGTNSPRRACSSPSRMAACASSSSGAIPPPSSVIANRTAASVS